MARPTSSSVKWFLYQRNEYWCHLHFLFTRFIFAGSASECRTIIPYLTLPNAPRNYENWPFVTNSTRNVPRALDCPPTRTEFKILSRQPHEITRSQHDGLGAGLHFQCRSADDGG